MSSHCTECGRPDHPLRRDLCHACYERRRRAGKIPTLVAAAPAYEVINRLRAAGWNYREISRAAGINRSLIAHIVNGRQTINADTSRAIVGIDPESLPKYRVNRCGWNTHMRQPKKRPGLLIDGLVVCCGDCERYPCHCPRAEDYDVPLLGRLEGGGPVLERSAS